MCSENKIDYKKTLFLYIDAAMGDVLYLISACQAIKKNRSSLILLTKDIYISLGLRCKWIADCWDFQRLSDDELKNVKEAQAESRFYNFTNWQHALCNQHMTDSFLSLLNIKANALDKTLDLNILDSEKIKVDVFLKEKINNKKKIVLMHPNIGHPNRTWPAEYWDQLSSLFIKGNWNVMFIGSNNNSEKNKKIINVENKKVINAIDKFTPLETIALMNRCDLLISCDSGPIMLAGATDIKIIGVYSTISSSLRLPFRHGELGWNCRGLDISCKYGPCAHFIQDEKIFTTLTNRKFSSPTVNEFANWCLNKNSFTCLNSYKPISLFKEAIDFISSI